VAFFLWYDSGEAALERAIDLLTDAIKKKEEEEKKRKQNCGGKIDCPGPEPARNSVPVKDLMIF
jgi:hypothetical protein